MTYNFPWKPLLVGIILLVVFLTLALIDPEQWGIVFILLVIIFLLSIDYNRIQKDN